MFTTNDTIVALSTPPGEGAIGVIRLSGDEAIVIANKIFSGKDLEQQPSHTLHFGKITDEEKILDEAVVSIYKSPQSYTGEDTAEISCHGSLFVLEQVIALCIKNGARPARPGEFTLRAFLRGKLDLAQAEAVADLIASHSGSSHRAALYNLRGGFSNELKEMREELIKLSALIELELDFSQEDVEFADRKQLYALIDTTAEKTQQLIDSFQLGNVIKNGVSVVIIGKPNAGKSTLLNALLNEDRAIVSEIAGTTRDTIEETLNINGILFRLIDTAGIRDHSGDAIEIKGVERSRDAMKKADIVVYLFDVLAADKSQLSSQKQEFEKSGSKYLLAGNKVDEKGLEQAKAAFDVIDSNIIYISAKNKENIQQLKNTLYHLIANTEIKTEGAIVTNTRHLAALKEVLQSLQDIKKGMDTNLPVDLISIDIRRCLHYLGDITGEVTTEDKLDYIFSKFCIGK